MRDTLDARECVLRAFNEVGLLQNQTKCGDPFTVRFSEGMDDHSTSVLREDLGGSSSAAMPEEEENTRSGKVLIMHTFIL